MEYTTWFSGGRGLHQSMRQSGTEMSLQRGIASLLHPERREAEALPSFFDEMTEFASEPGVRDSVSRRAENGLRR